MYSPSSYLNKKILTNFDKNCVIKEKGETWKHGKLTYNKANIYDWFIRYYSKYINISSYKVFFISILNIHFRLVQVRYTHFIVSPHIVFMRSFDYN